MAHERCLWEGLQVDGAILLLVDLLEEPARAATSYGGGTMGCWRGVQRCEGSIEVGANEHQVLTLVLARGPVIGAA